MAGLCKVTLIGNLGRDPEIRNTQNGMVIAKFSLATSEKWKNKISGEMHTYPKQYRFLVRFE